MGSVDDIDIFEGGSADTNIGMLGRLQNFFTEQARRKTEREMMNEEARRLVMEKYAPSYGQLANFGAMLLPSAGTIDAEGSWPSIGAKDQPFSEAFSNAPYPSMAENLQRGGWGGYFDAGMQGLGVVGDALWAVPAVGPLVGAAVGTPLKTVSAVGRAARGSRGIASLDETQQMLREAVNQFARDESGFFSPTIRALIEQAPPDLKGQGIVDWARANANKGVKPKELEFLGLDEFVAANPNATTREAVEGISGNRVRVSQNVRGGGGEGIEFERTIAETDPLDGSNLWEPLIQDVDNDITGSSRSAIRARDDLLDHYNQKWLEENTPADRFPRQLSSFDDIPQSAIDDLVEDFAKHQYMDNPYELIDPQGEQFGPAYDTFALGNEETGYQLFVNGERVTDPDNIAYSGTEAEIQLQQKLGLEDYGGTEFKTYVDNSLPGGENYREVVFNWDNAPQTHNIGHFYDENQIAHALVRDRTLDDGTPSLHIDELQSDLHTKGSREGYQLPERLKIEQHNKIEKVLSSGDDLRLSQDGITVPNLGGPARIWLSFGDIRGIAKWLRESADPDYAMTGAEELVESLGAEKIYELADLAKPLTEAGPVPDYPFKDNWYEMVIKNLLLDAAREGKPALSISGSAPIKARYSEQYSRFYEMLYDRKVPSFMKKLANRYGGEFEKGGRLDLENTYSGREGGIWRSRSEALDEFSLSLERRGESIDFDNPVEMKLVEEEFDSLLNANIIRITPEMRERILEEGIPSFGGGGTVHSGIANLKRARANKHNAGGFQHIQQFQHGGAVDDTDIFSPEERLQGIEFNGRKKPPYPEGEDPTAYRWTGEGWVRKSDTGWLGPRRHITGATMTEFSIGNIDNPLDPDDPLRPSMVPTLTEEEIGFLTTLPVGVSPREWGEHPLGRSVLEKSWDHYKMRVGQGLSPFLTHDEESPRHTVQQFQHGGAVEDIDIFEDGNADTNIRRRGRHGGPVPYRSEHRYSNRPSYNPETALGEIDPAFNRGLHGFIEQDPSSFFRGAAASLPALPQDLIGLAQQGLNYSANKTLKDALNLLRYYRGLDPVTEDDAFNFTPFGEPTSGNWIREAMGLDPSNPQGLAGEMLSPVATMAKTAAMLPFLVRRARAAAKPIDEGIGALPRGADEGSSVIDASTDVASAHADQRRLSEVIAVEEQRRRMLAAREFNESTLLGQRKKFSESLENAKASMNPQDAAQVSSLPANFSGKTYLTDDGMSGFTITEGGTLENLFRHPDAQFMGVMGAALTKARAAGAKNLEAFDTYLAKGYVNRGAVETNRFPFNPSQGTPAIRAALGELQPDFVQMDIGGVIPEQKFSNLIEPPPQIQLPTYQSARGEPQVITEAFQGGRSARLKRIVQQGVEEGGERWYWMAGLLDQFILELGPELGVKRFNKLMDLNAGVSPRSAVDTQIKRASVLYQRVVNKQPITPLTGDMFPPGYGHLATTTAHSGAIDRLVNTGAIGSSINQPKIVRYSANTKGNYAVLTSDGHNNLIVTGRAGSPTIAQYPFLESRQQKLAEAVGLDPAEWQSALWVGGGDITKVRDTRNLAPAYNRAIARVAEDLDIPEQEVLIKFIHGDVILRSIVLGVAASFAGVALNETRQQGGEL